MWKCDPSSVSRLNRRKNVASVLVLMGKIGKVLVYKFYRLRRLKMNIEYNPDIIKHRQSSKINSNNNTSNSLLHTHLFDANSEGLKI